MMVAALSQSRPALRARAAALDSAVDRRRLLETEWRGSAGPAVITIEHAERLVAVPDALGVLCDTLEALDSPRHLVICTRARLPLSTTALLGSANGEITLRAGDLQFDEFETRSVLAPLELASDHIETIASLTRGWPAALFYLRRHAGARTLENLLRDCDDAAWASFHDYVQHEVVESLSPEARTLLFTYVADPGIRDGVLQSLYNADTVARGLLDLGTDLAMVQDGGADGYFVHPLVRSVVSLRYKLQLGEAMRALARIYSATQPIQAAQLYLQLEQKEAAVQAYGRASLTHIGNASYASASQAATLDRETLISNLALFNSVTISDYYALAVDDWLAQAGEALRRAPADTPFETRSVTLLNMVIRFGLVGRFQEGHALLKQERRLNPNDAQRAVRLRLFEAILEANADALLDVRQLHREIASLLSSEYVRGLFARRIAAPVASLMGAWATTQRELEIAFSQVQKSGRTPYLVELAIAGCFEAWWNMDATAMDLWRERLLAYEHEPELAPGLIFFLDCLRGRAATATERFETNETRMRGYLIASSMEYDAEQALRFAKRALLAAETMRRPLYVVLARVALACIDPRAEHLDVAREQAGATPSLALQEAVEAIVSGRREHGMLAGFTYRFSKPRIPLHRELEIDTISGEVRWKGEVVNIEQRPFQLLLFMALKRAPVRIDEIVTALWPGKNSTEMANAFRVHINALRNALSKAAIRYENERYSLACSTVLDVQVLEARLSRSRTNPVLSAEDRAFIADAIRRFEQHDGIYAECQWLVELTNHLSEVRFEALLSLARDALTASAYTDAVAYAQRASHLQPWDEAACEIVIRALLSQGKRTDAFRHYHLFRDDLARSLVIQPSPSLVALIEAS